MNFRIEYAQVKHSMAIIAYVGGWLWWAIIRISLCCPSVRMHV